MKAPRCSKCGRSLKDPVSIARGIGPICAGVSMGGSSSKRAKPRSGSGRGYYSAFSLAGVQMPLFAYYPDDPILKTGPSRKRQIAHAKEMRRRLYENHLPFEVGQLSRTGEPILYSPTPDNSWVTNNGHATSHEALGKYLRRYGLI